MRVGSLSGGGGSVAAYAADGELDLRGLSAALWRQRWRVILPTLFVAVVTFAFVNTLTPRYASEARVLIDVRENVFLRPEAERSTPERVSVDEQGVTSQVQVFLSRDLARDVIQKLKLGASPEFDPLIRGLSPLKTILIFFGLAKDPMTMSPEERVLQSYYDRLNVSSVERSRVIAVQFQSEDPELAAKVANAIAGDYLAFQQESKRDQARAAGQWLSAEIESLRKKVSEAEEKASEFRSRANLFVNSNNTSLANQQLAELSTQLATARTQKADAEARARLIRAMLRSGQPIEAGDIINSELIRRLNEQRVTLLAQLAEQSATLLSGHPRIKELRAQVADLVRQIRQEAQMRVRALESEARIAGARVDTINAGLDQLKNRAAASNEQDVKLRALEREAKAQRDLLASYLAKYREATARDNIGAAPADARIISRATASNIPVFPKKMQMVLIATMLAFTLSGGFVATRELLSADSFRPISPARSTPEPSAAPAAKPYRRSGSAGLAAASRPALPVPLKVIEELAEMLRQAGEDGRRVTIFGAQRGVGTSLTAVTLARALARDSRVVLIDLALGAPNLSAISTDPKAPGVAELVAGKATIGEIITKDQLSKVHLIGAGQGSRDTGAVLASPRLAMTIEALAHTYDHIILDAGAVSEMSAEPFAQFAPTGVLVSADPSDRATTDARVRLQAAGFGDVTVLIATDLE